MPELRYYTVTQEREVKVSAESAIDAARIAELAFTDGEDGDLMVLELPGRALTPIRTRNIVVREDY